MESVFPFCLSVFQNAVVVLALNRGLSVKIQDLLLKLLHEK